MGIDIQSVNPYQTSTTTLLQVSVLTDKTLMLKFFAVLLVTSTDTIQRTSKTQGISSSPL